MGFTIATYTFYGLILLNYLFATRILNQILNALNVKLPRQESIFKRIKYHNLKMRSSFLSKELEHHFQISGYPFGLNARRFQIFRFLIGVVTLSYGIYRVWQFPAMEPIQKLLYIVCPLIFLFVLSNPKQKAMKMFFKIYRNRNEYLKNQELFMIHSMITDELRETSNAVNVLDTLSRLRQYSPRISGSINKGLRYRKSGIDMVMKIIGDDINNDEAKEVCKIIAGLQNASNDNVHELIANREQSYVATLRANRLNRRVTITNVANVIVWLPLFIYLMDIMFVVMQMINSMGTSLTKLD